MPYMPHIDPQNHPNVGIYGIHGVSGYDMVWLINITDNMELDMSHQEKMWAFIIGEVCQKHRLWQLFSALQRSGSPVSRNAARLSPSCIHSSDALEARSLRSEVRAVQRRSEGTGLFKRRTCMRGVPFLCPTPELYNKSHGFFDAFILQRHL